MAVPNIYIIIDYQCYTFKVSQPSLTAMSLEPITLMVDLPTHTPTQNRVRVMVGVRDKVRRGWG